MSNRLIDKVIILFICLSIYLHNVANTYLIVPILICVFLSSIISYRDNGKVLIILSMCFLILCFFNSDYLFFIPLMCYDLISYKIKWLWLFLIFPILIYSFEISPSSIFLILAYTFISYILNYRTKSYEHIKKNYYYISDSANELSMKFENKNRELLEKQDYEVNLATLGERNRIARDIHDNVGHLLSRCILQIGALLAINKDENINLNLRLVKDTLSEAMDSIRSSVHDLHEDAVDLQVEIQQLVDNFKFCSIKLDYDLESNPIKKIRYSFISITKEALSNIIKHSNATEVSIFLREHPSLYQLVIHDNGSNIKYNSENGIGIKNIKDRIASINGSLNISTDNGFRIFISVPKKLD
ncbi:sensor histidine kinase [Terrisporobacter mayombei]|uniref:histidine kinase n=1 Tax=Terrisporobacter mayombei TaxID=1541 RepID=A0ABY9PXA2_9FIRM|nr:histidine kinase [Terrisporobacter mayombei]WMT80318.1 hypothetical protein TEMA_06330 [Terrisporobacter mayombei]